MSLDITRKVKGYLSSSSSVTSYIPSKKIKTGWPRTLDEFPCIIITQSTGSDLGYFGYRTASAGSKIRKETATIQLDIISKNSRLETYNIADATVKVMISGNFTKESDNESYDDELHLYRKIQTYNYIMFHDD